MAKAKADKAEQTLLKFVAYAGDLSLSLGALGADIDQYATDCSGSADHTLALAAAKKGTDKARKELEAARLGLLAAHGAAQIKPPAEQLQLAKAEKDGKVGEA